MNCLGALGIYSLGRQETSSVKEVQMEAVEVDWEGMIRASCLRGKEGD